MNNESIGFPYMHFRSESALQTGLLMFQIVLPVLLTFGSVGNILSIIVLSRKSMKKKVSSAYLLGLSVADLLVLCVCLMRDWISYIKVDIRNLSDFTCKVQYWLHYALLDFSIWILTSLTVERFLSTFTPFNSVVICAKRHSKHVIVIVLLVDLVVHSHFLFGMKLQEVKDTDGNVQNTCRPQSDDYERFFKYVWHYIDLVLFSILPFIILSLSNSFIIYRVVLNKRKVKANIRETPSSPETKPSTGRKISSMTKLLVTLNIIFIITTAPICIYLVCKPYFIPEDIPIDIQEQDPWYAFVKILMYMNNTFNFILYCISGSRFRRELKRLFQRLVKRYQSAQQVSSTHTSQRSSRSTQNVIQKPQTENLGLL